MPMSFLTRIETEYPKIWNVTCIISITSLMFGVANRLALAQPTYHKAFELFNTHIMVKTVKVKNPPVLHNFSRVNGRAFRKLRQIL